MILSLEWFDLHCKEHSKAIEWTAAHVENGSTQTFPLSHVWENTEVSGSKCRSEHNLAKFLLEQNSDQIYWSPRMVLSNLVKILGSPHIFLTYNYNYMRV